MSITASVIVYFFTGLLALSFFSAPSIHKSQNNPEQSAEPQDEEDNWDKNFPF